MNLTATTYRSKTVHEWNGPLNVRWLFGAYPVVMLIYVQA